MQASPRQYSKVFAAWCALVATTGLIATPAEAGKYVSVCRDQNGNAVFSDVGCSTDTSELGQVYAGSAQGYGGGSPAAHARGYSVEEQLDRVEAQKERVRQRQAAEYERWQAQQGPGYWDETAARNAMVTIRSEGDLPNRHYKPKNAAEMAIEYNAESVAGGGRHQVRVPDVYETHIHYNDSRGDGTSRPCFGANDFNCVKKW